MPPELRDLFLSQHRLATSPQIHELISHGAFQRHLRRDQIVKVWPNIYSLGEPNVRTKLRGLDLRCGEQVAACLHTAAQAYGFGT